MRQKIGLAVLGLVLAAASARADIDKSAARAVLEKSKKAVITARVVLKINMGGRERESKLEVTGTVIDPSGLTVVSASAIDPTETLRGGFGGRRGGGGGGGDMKIDAEVTETTLVLDDGTEVEADVVLKDAELDLAFMRPRDEKTKVDAIELKPHEAAPQELDEVFVVGRLGRVASHAPAISKGFVRAVVKGPRPFYVTDELVAMNTGCLVWDEKGAALGLLVHKSKAGEGGRPMTMVVVRPIADVIELAGQAKTAKAPEKKKTEEPKKEDGKKTEDGKKPPTDGKKPEESSKKDDGKKKEEDE